MGHKKPNGRLRAALQSAVSADRDQNSKTKGKRTRRFPTDSEIAHHLGVTTDTQPAYALAGEW